MREASLGFAAMIIEKARESLRAAELCFEGRLYNSAANRAYYAMFQAAVVALERAGIQPLGKHWNHEGVQAMFSLELTTRRKMYPRQWTSRLAEALKTRNEADYKQTMVSEKRARQVLRLTREFVELVEKGTSHE